MCTFLAVAVAAGDPASVRAICPRGLNADLCSNESIAAIVGQDFRTYWLTAGHCSCGLAPRDASAPDSAEESEPLESKLRRKYASRGWSSAKVDRAIADALAAAARPSIRINPGLRDDAAAFVRSLYERFGKVRLVAHVFDGALDATLALRGGGRLDVAHLTTDAIEYDRCYDVVVDGANAPARPTGWVGR